MADTLNIFGTEYNNVTGIIATTPNETDLTYIRPQGTKSISANGTGIDVASYASVDVAVPSSSPTIQSLTVTPSTSQQTFNASGVDGYKPVTVNAMSTMTLPSSASSTSSGTSKATITPTSSAQYLNIPTGYNGTAQYYTIAASSGSSKNAQVVQGTTRTNSSTMTAIGAEMTVSKTGTYNVYWSAFRNNTSSGYTWTSRLYIDGTAYGTANTSFTNNQQNNHLTNVSLTANQKIRVYGSTTRGSSYYISAPTLVIVEA